MQKLQIRFGDNRFEIKLERPALFRAADGSEEKPVRPGDRWSIGQVVLEVVSDIEEPMPVIEAEPPHVSVETSAPDVTTRDRMPAMVELKAPAAAPPAPALPPGVIETAPPNVPTRTSMPAFAAISPPALPVSPQVAPPLTEIAAMADEGTQVSEAIPTPPPPPPGPRAIEAPSVTPAPPVPPAALGLESTPVHTAIPVLEPPAPPRPAPPVTIEAPQAEANTIMVPPELTAEQVPAAEAASEDSATMISPAEAAPPPAPEAEAPPPPPVPRERPTPAPESRPAPVLASPPAARPAPPPVEPLSKSIAEPGLPVVPPPAPPPVQAGLDEVTPMVAPPRLESSGSGIMDASRLSGRAAMQKTQVLEVIPKLIVTLENVTFEHVLFREVTRIGRDQGNDLCLPDTSVSRYHCTVNRDKEGRFTIRDLGSTNGVLVNGRQHESVSLKDGDDIELGNYKVKFLSGVGVDAAAAEPPTADFRPLNKPATARPTTSPPPRPVPPRSLPEAGARKSAARPAGAPPPPPPASPPPSQPEPKKQGLFSRLLGKDK